MNWWQRIARQWWGRPVWGRRPSGDAGRVDWVRAQVSSVSDGDTIKVMVNGVQETVRLLLIDTPETVHPNKPQQPFGAEASQYVKNSLPIGCWVDLEMNIQEKDKYGRYLAYVWMNGQMLNQALVAVGLAKVAFTSAGDVKYLPVLKDIELRAKMQGTGIWSLPENQSQRVVNPSGSAIKATVSKRGKPVYYLPLDRGYHTLQYFSWYPSEETARADGFKRVRK